MKLLHSVCAKLIYAKLCLTECAISNVVDYMLFILQRQYEQYHIRKEW